MRLYYSSDYTAAAQELETTRKSAWIAESLAADPIPGVELVAPEPLTAEELCQVHDSDYVQAVQTGEPRRIAETNSITWDPNIWRMACATAGGTVAAARAAWRDGVAGSLSSGLHHARQRRGGPFCTFNGLVLAARTFLAEHGGTVLILDLDAHCGGGTASLIRDDERIWQLDISVSEFDRYTSRPPRLTLELVRDHYLPTIRERLTSLTGHFDLCLYNAGMDPCPEIPADELAAREQFVFEWLRARSLPVAFVLAGGYLGDQIIQSDLVHLHRLTIDAAARSSSDDSPRRG